MKLGKSKLALAKVINENGGWVGVADCATQDKDGWVCSYEGKPTRCGDSWKDNGDCLYKYGFDSREKIQNWHQCVLSREEYYQAYPKADADGWIEWSGGECKVDDDDMVEVKLRNPPLKNLKRVRKACEFDWSWDGIDDGEIVAYRLHKPEVKPEFCKSVMRSIPEPESIDGLCAKVAEENKHQHVDAKPTIEQLSHDYRNAKDYAERLQKEADDAKAAADAALGELERAGEALGLVVKQVREDRTPNPIIADFRYLKIGDAVRIVRDNIGGKYNGYEGHVAMIDPDDTRTPVLVNLSFGPMWCHEVEFIR